MDPALFLKYFSISHQQYLLPKNLNYNIQFNPKNYIIISDFIKVEREK